MTTRHTPLGGSTQGLYSVADLLRNRCAATPDATAVELAGAALSYAELAELAERTAGALRSRGIGQGNRVALLAGNSTELLGALFGGAISGVVIAPLNWHHRGPVLDHMVRGLRPALVIGDRALLDDDQLATVRTAAPGRFVERADWEAEVDAASPHAGGSFGRGDLMTIMYTSGTTGRSKGAELTHGLYLAEAASFNLIVDPREDDRYFTTLPLFHTNAQCLTLLGGVLAGVPAIVRERFSASGLMEQIRESDATVLNVLGAMVPMFLKRSVGHGPQGRLRLLVGGAIPEDLIDECSTRFEVGFRRIYGLTETGLNAGEFDGAARGSMGRPLPHNEARVSGDGEIQLLPRDRRDYFRGYWEDPDASAQMWTDDGWFRTGDLGRVDDAGFLHFVGRRKETIRRRGENISCAEVELALSAVPQVLECAAVAVASEMAEDEVKLVYVVRPGAELSWQDVWAICRERMAAFMVPRYYQQVDLIPRTPTEKVERYRLTGLDEATVHDAEAVPS